MRCPSCHKESIQPEMDLDGKKILKCMLCASSGTMDGFWLGGRKRREFERIYGISNQPNIGGRHK